MPDIRQLPDAGYPAGYPATAGCRIAGYPATAGCRIAGFFAEKN